MVVVLGSDLFVASAPDFGLRYGYFVGCNKVFERLSWKSIEWDASFPPPPRVLRALRLKLKTKNTLPYSETSPSRL